MRRFTHDVETVELTADEMCAFAGIVTATCHLHVQHGISQFLENVTERMADLACDRVQKSARLLWRTAVCNRE